MQSLKQMFVTTILALSSFSAVADTAEELFQKAESTFKEAESLMATEYVKSGDDGFRIKKILSNLLRVKRYWKKVLNYTKRLPKRGTLKLKKFCGLENTT